MEVAVYFYCYSDSAADGSHVFAVDVESDRGDDAAVLVVYSSSYGDDSGDSVAGGFAYLAAE